jgi:hypothetical protein
VKAINHDESQVTIFIAKGLFHGQDSVNVSAQFDSSSIDKGWRAQRSKPSQKKEMKYFTSIAIVSWRGSEEYSAVGCTRVVFLLESTTARGDEQNLR